MRMDQHFGLNAWAEDLVKGKTVHVYTERIDRIYPSGAEIEQPDRPIYRSDVTKEVIEGKVYSGMFGDQYPLHRYKLANGKVYFEFVQSDAWSSGPCFFIALMDVEGKQVEASLWADEDIERA